MKCSLICFSRKTPLWSSKLIAGRVTAKSKKTLDIHGSLVKSNQLDTEKGIASPTISQVITKQNIKSPGEGSPSKKLPLSTIGKEKQTSADKAKFSFKPKPSKAEESELNRLRNEMKSIKTKIQKATSKKSMRLIPKQKDRLPGTLQCKTGVLKLVIQQLLEQVGKPELIVNFNIEKAIDDVITMHNNFITHLGIKFGTSKYKLVQQYCVALMEGQKWETIKPVDRLSIGLVDKWPNALGSLRPLWHQVRDRGPFAVAGEQIIRTLFSMQRIVEDFREIDIENIEYKANINKEFLNEFKEFVRNKYRSLNLLKKEGDPIKDYIVKPPLNFTANGPNKAPKCDSAALEAHILLYDELGIPFKRLCELTGNSEYLKFQEHVATYFRYDQRGDRIKDPAWSPDKLGEDKDNSFYHSPNVNVADTYVLRKLTAVTDSGNKSRTVAIPDYWTQCLLTPFEDRVIEVLKIMYPTCSNIFDHAGGFEKLKKYIKSGTRSTDAVSWTDTFSVRFQSPHVVCLFGEEFNENWLKLVVRCKWSLNGSSKLVRYLTGQGMGTKGSFAIASLGYLSLIEFLLTKKYPELIKRDVNGVITNLEELFNEVGDDLWNQDPMGLIQQSLVEDAGLKINISKSKIATEGNLVGEFVSRNLNYGNDVSRISTNLCKNAEENIFYLTNLFIHINERVPSFDWTSFIKKVYNLSKNSKPLFPDHIWISYYRALIVDRIIRKDDSFSQLLIAIEATLPKTLIGSDLIQNLRTRLKIKSEKVLRLSLTLMECEYMYSRIISSVTSSKDFLGKFPFGTFTKVLNGSYFNIDYIKNMDSFHNLSQLYMYTEIKNSASPALFKLSLGTDADIQAINLDSVLLIAETLQETLSDIFDQCFYDKEQRKLNLSMKVRIDRSYSLQKELFHEREREGQLLLECLPNLGLLFDMDMETFQHTMNKMDDRDFSTEVPSHQTSEKSTQD